MEKDFYWTVDGNRWVKINGIVMTDYLEMKWMLKGYRKTAAQLYLENLGFSEDEAEEFLEALPQGEL